MSDHTRADEGEGREPELTQAEAIRDELHVYAAQLRKMETQAGMGGRDLAVRVKEPDWLIRLMIRAASALEVRDRCGLAARASQAEAEVARLTERVAVLEGALRGIGKNAATACRIYQGDPDEGAKARLACWEIIRKSARTALEAPHDDN